jgi:hypothetical protein
MPRVRSTGFSICPHQLLDQIAEPGGKQRVCVYLLLHRHGNGSPHGCYASVTTLSRELGSSRRDVMAAIRWLIDNGWATYAYDDGHRRHIYLNADRRQQRSAGAPKGTEGRYPKRHRGIQKGTNGQSALLGTDPGIQKGTQTRTHEQDPSMALLSTDVLTKSIDADSCEKNERTKVKPLPPELEQHRELIQAFWKIKKGSKGDIAWKLLCTELLKFYGHLGPSVVEEQLTHAINGKWAGINYNRHLQFNPHLVNASISTPAEYVIR